MRYVTIITIGSIAIFTIAFYDTLARLLWIGGLLVLAGVSLAALGYSVYWILIAREQVLTAQLQRKRSQYVEFTDGFGMLHLLNLLTDRVENLSTYPGSHHNGTWEDPKPAAAAAWYALVGKARADSPVALLPGSVEGAQPQTDLLTLIDHYPHTHFWGGTGDGKTSILRTVGHRRKAAGHEVYVLDSSEHPARWAGLTRIQDAREQDEMIAKFLSLHRLNSQALGQGQAIESDFNQITILSDEWTDIVRRTEEARVFIDEMSRKSRKSGVHCGFSTQTKLAADLGLDGRYQVIRNFLQVEVVRSPDGIYMARAVYGGSKIGEFIVPAPPPEPVMLSSGYTPPALAEVRIDEVIQPGAKDKAVEIRDYLTQLLSDGIARSTSEIRQELEEDGMIATSADWAYVRSVANRAGMTKAGHGYWQL